MTDFFLIIVTLSITDQPAGVEESILYELVFDK